MFNLIGIYYDHVEGADTPRKVRELVATFDLQGDAMEYVKKAALKRPNSWSNRPFKKRSLLGKFESACVENIICEIHPPHNPIAE
jgi:hypothetical protein